MSTVTWKKGPPPGRGNWWVVWDNGAVFWVNVGPAYINRHDPEATLLLSWASAGPAARFEKAIPHIKYHARVEKPDAPEVET